MVALLCEKNFCLPVAKLRGRKLQNRVGNLIGKRVGTSGPITAYEYDALNRLRKVDYEHGSWPVGTITTADVTYAYVGGSRLRDTMTDSTGESGYDYDIQDRLVTYTPAAQSNREIGYVYNALGQKTNMTLKQSGTPKLDVDYLYYANGWLKEVDKGNSWLAKYTYDEIGNRTRVDLVNGTSTTYDFGATDPRSFVEAITHYDGATAISQVDYQQRDDSGNPNYIDLDWGTTSSYTYDANNRLANASGTVYNYDWVGNRKYPPSNPMTYDATDKLVTWPTQHQYTYYPSGSLYQQKSSGGTLQKTYTYTAAELLESVTHVGASYPTEMAWDADSNRVSFTSSEDDATTEFVYDTTAGIPAVVEEITPADGSFYYVREPGGELIARVEGSTGTPPVLYYYFDELGSTHLITDAAGDMTDVYLYDAWGNTYHIYGSTEQPYQYVGQLGYYTHYQDDNLDLLQLGVRFYDPETGRFTQRDPVPALTASNYAYVQDRPTALVDPSGEIVTELVCAAARWFAACHTCSRRASDKGYTETEEYLYKYRIAIDNSGDKGRNERNALGHCVRACRTMRDCRGVFDCVGGTGVRAYLNGVYEFPIPEFIKPRRGEECRMDKHNNNIGMACADEKGKSCVQCCMDHQKEWEILDPPKPK